jgi:hypothetical protein
VFFALTGHGSEETAPDPATGHHSPVLEGATR